MSASSTRPTVAVIGSGLAGLTTAYILRREGCEVYLIEKSVKLGFHSASVDIPLASSSAHVRAGDKGVRQNPKSRPWTVDVPMRSFQGGYYPRLISLYRHLGIPLVPTYFDFSFSTLLPASRRSASSPSDTSHRTRSSHTYFTYAGASGISIPRLPSTSFSSLFALLDGLIHLLYTALCFLGLILLSFLSWHRLFPALLGHGTTLDTLRHRLWPIPVSAFIDNILVPVFSSVGTMTASDVLQAPLPVLLEYVHAGMGTPHYTLGKGFSAASVAARLVQPVQAQGEQYVKLGHTITRLEHKDGRVEVGFEQGAGISVDRLVIATQPSAARSLLRLLSPTLNAVEEKRVEGMILGLGDVDSRDTIVVTHRDSAVLPVSEDVRTINFTLPSSFISAHTAETQTSVTTPYWPPTPDQVYTMGTHVISPPAGLTGEKEIYQTTNPIIPIDPDRVLGVARLERALPLRDASTFGQLHPQPASDVVHLAGSYAYPGIPLLEGCVGSARLAAARVLGEGDALPGPRLGGVDWMAGRGGLVGRVWRWRSRSTDPMLVR